MTPELEQQLRSKYPVLFLNNPEISIGDGWYQLLDNLCGTISHHVQYAYPEELQGQVVIGQLKEKFAGLRAYFDHTDDFCNGVIAMAEVQSFYICEECGNKGKLTNIGNWLLTLCQEDEAKARTELEQRYKGSK